MIIMLKVGTWCRVNTESKRKDSNGNYPAGYFHTFDEGTIVQIKRKITSTDSLCTSKTHEQQLDDRHLDFITNLQMGDKVRIRESSEFYGTDSNPSDEIGIVDSIYDYDTNLPIGVQWKSCHNAYKDEDLEKVEDEQELKIEPPKKLTIGLGDIVKISTKSEYFGNGPHNPANIKGTVVRINDSTHPIEVEWENHSVNIYRNEDLVILKKIAK